MPRGWVKAGPFVSLYLVNNGGLARNVHVDVIHAEEKWSLYAISLAENDKLRILQDGIGRSKKGGKLSIHVKYADA